ncbi:MAG TPA: hypothetical protein VJ792_00805 [Candidatus Nitrosotalea sp.]|nr:hypothetical protein [Candidatus Nitrosotalea sp.]
MPPLASQTAHLLWFGTDLKPTLPDGFIRPGGDISHMFDTDFNMLFSSKNAEFRD